jgi:hypothetical protein
VPSRPPPTSHYLQSSRDVATERKYNVPIDIILFFSSAVFIFSALDILQSDFQKAYVSNKLILLLNTLDELKKLSFLSPLRNRSRQRWIGIFPGLSIWAGIALIGRTTQTSEDIILYSVISMYRFLLF